MARFMPAMKPRNAASLTFRGSGASKEAMSKFEPDPDFTEDMERKFRRRRFLDRFHSLSRPSLARVA